MRANKLSKKREKIAWTQSLNQCVIEQILIQTLCSPHTYAHTRALPLVLRLIRSAFYFGLSGNIRHILSLYFEARAHIGACVEVYELFVSKLFAFKVKLN